MKIGLSLNNRQRLICYKTQTNKQIHKQANQAEVWRNRAQSVHVFYSNILFDSGDLVQESTSLVRKFFQMTKITQN